MDKKSRNPFVNQVNSYRSGGSKGGDHGDHGRNPFVNQVNSYRTVVVNGINVVFASQSLRKSGQFLQDESKDFFGGLPPRVAIPS